jgi:hypothetical protein
MNSTDGYITPNDDESPRMAIPMSKERYASTPPRHGEPLRIRGKTQCRADTGERLPF